MGFSRQVELFAVWRRTGDALVGLRDAGDGDLLAVLRTAVRNTPSASAARAR